MSGLSFEVVSDFGRLSAQEVERIESREHPLGAEVPELSVHPSIFQTRGGEFETEYLGVKTEWKVRRGELHADDLLNLYSWNYREGAVWDGVLFRPGMMLVWHDPGTFTKKRRKRKVMLLAVGTECARRVLHLIPALMVRLGGNTGAVCFALPAEVDL